MPESKNTNYFLTGLLVCSLIYVTVRLSRCSSREHFTELQGSRSDYIREIRNLSALVGPYLGSCYEYLRAKYMDPDRPLSIHYIPGSDHPSLKDPALPLARTHLKNWIDSWKASMRTRFDSTVIDEMSREYDISYVYVVEPIGDRVRNALVEDPKERLQVIFKEREKERIFIL